MIENQPYDDDAERALLGALLLDPDTLRVIHDILLPGDFYSETHRLVYRAIRELDEDGRAGDLITVTNHLQERHLLDRAGGASYLSHLVDVLPDVANARYYALIVRDKSIKRAIIKASELATTAASSDWPVDQILEDHRHTMAELERRVLSEGDPEQIGTSAARAMARVDAIKGGDLSSLGWPTGIKPLDTRFGCLSKKNLYVLAGGVSAGKSAMADQIADHVAEEGGKVLVFCLEMSLEQRAQRFLARRTGLSLRLFQEPRYIPAPMVERLREEARKLKEPPILMDDTRSLRPIDILARSKRVQDKYGLDLIIIDYLQLLRPTHRASREQEVAEMVGEINTMAAELDVPVLLLSQLSRAHQHEGRRPDLRDLRESGRIEQDAFGVIMVYRPDLEEALCEVLIRKNRQGALGMGRMHFAGDCVTFKELAPDGYERYDTHGEDMDF